MNEGQLPFPASATEVETTHSIVQGAWRGIPAWLNPSVGKTRTLSCLHNLLGCHQQVMCAGPAEIKVIKSTGRICSEVGYKRERVAQQCSVANWEQKAFTCTNTTTEQGVQGHSSNSYGLTSTLSELTQQCKAHHHPMYHTLHPLPTCDISDTSQVNKCQTMPQPKYNWKVPTLRVTLLRVTKFVTHKCYEEVEESEKLPWVGHLCLEPPVLCHWRLP